MAKLRDQDIISNIIIRLPVKSILQFRCVSKAWCKLLKDPDFVKKHLSHAIEMNKFSVMMHPCYDLHEKAHALAYDPFSSTLSNPASINYPLARTFWGTCNGLICLTTTSEKDVVLWNPTTKEFKEVPIESADDFSNYKHGFGYGDEIDDFKVVSFVGFEDVYFSEVRVYTLKSNSWRRLENIPYLLCHGEMDMSQVSVHGAMHWLALSDTEPDKVIVSFDFKDDKFDEMPLPSFFHDEYAETNLCPLGGSLCLHGSIYGCIDVWEMKEFAVTESWVKLFTIPYQADPRQLVPLQVVKNGEILLGYDDRKGYHLDLYDLKHGTSINLKAYANWGWYFSVTFAYVESLLPLNSGTYVGQREIERKRLQRQGMAKLQDKNILLNILVRLPVKSILRFRCVSKAWCKLLENPKFVKKTLEPCY
ncbi:F-box/kelch-repeat protein At3g23880-like [Papaver somniferum]|uniref:F-box/kelch-repeat protein At3g23880-like n=1 Tax=Papaver somniferum TaxID=3469 RepID=UPI000E6F9206|nr:F-box/kelch-repeat protein At3g23880-like [Papaver somniferum]XP_026412484.1 F-box/kelch-repeat protein At3g23880-like [Papaver somniferum]